MKIKISDERFAGKILTIQNLIPSAEQPLDLSRRTALFGQLKENARKAAKKNINAATVEELRLCLGLSPAEFAARLGISVPTVSRWENPEGRPIPGSKISRLVSLLSGRGTELPKSSYPELWIEVETNHRQKLWGIDILAVQKPEGEKYIEMQTGQSVTFRVCIIQRPWDGDYEPVLRAFEVLHCDK
ncbi:MAG: helix-turn-helix domain-containing protein [Patescibacteria group bacterium]